MADLYHWLEYWFWTIADESRSVYMIESHGLTVITTKVPGDLVRKRKQLSLWETQRASRYCIAERKEGIRNCDCVTCCVAGIREYDQKETK